MQVKLMGVKRVLWALAQVGVQVAFPLVGGGARRLENFVFGELNTLHAYFRSFSV